jgi:hypothetical protein
MTLLDEITAKIGGLDPKARQALVEQVMPLKQRMRFVPLPGPQTEAYLSKADVLLYAGEAGSGKSGLLIGLSQEHSRGIIFRRESSQTDGLEEFGRQVIGDSARYNGTDKEWTWADGKALKLAGMQLPSDWIKHAGRERDLIEYDEAGEFLRDQVASMLAWLRGPEGQRCRMVLASNPPRTSDGYWMLEWFAPWLDINWPDRAEPGEIRWAVMVNGSPQWVAGPGMVEVDGEMRSALSFTCIRASLKDNPYRDTPEYRARIDSLPEPLRSQLKYGDFTAGTEDAQNQAIPSEWIKEAMRRWKPQAPIGVPQCAIGVDVAQGGTDQTVIATRHDGWYAPLEAVPGSETPSGAEVAGKVLARRRDNSMVVVDLGGGWGGDALTHLAVNIGQEYVFGYMGVKVSMRRTRDNQLRFKNVRTQAIWQFREALDPYQPGGSPVALPDDRELLADLASVTYSVVSEKGGMAIAAETKEALIKRLGRSTDKGDAVVMAWHSGPKAVTDFKEWEQRRVGSLGGRVPKVIMGRESARRRR